MERAEVDGITIEYEVSGAATGEPVLLIHGALLADTFRLLVAEPILAGRYRLITYRRRGYVGSTHGPDMVSVGHHARDCRALSAHLGIASAHVVGHSYGGSVALQLALDFPELVQTLAVLEPAVFAGSAAQGYQQALARDRQRYRDEGARAAVDAFLLPRFGAGYRSWLDPALPGGFDQAMADAGTWFERELPALPEWRFGEAEARRIGKRVLCVLGAESDALWPRFGETHRLLQSWLPNAQGFLLPGATHGLQLQNPRTLAEALAAFFARHPLQ